MTSRDGSRHPCHESRTINLALVAGPGVAPGTSGNEPDEILFLRIPHQTICPVEVSSSSRFALSPAGPACPCSGEPKLNPYDLL